MFDATRLDAMLFCDVDAMRRDFNDRVRRPAAALFGSLRMWMRANASMTPSGWVRLNEGSDRCVVCIVCYACALRAERI